MKRKGGDPARIRKHVEKDFIDKMVDGETPEKAALITSLLKGDPHIEMVSLNVRLPKEEMEAFRAICEERGVSISQAIRTLMKLYKFVKAKK